MTDILMLTLVKTSQVNTTASKKQKFLAQIGLLKRGQILIDLNSKLMNFSFA